MTLKIKKLDPRAKIPTRSTAGSAGMDLCALLDEPLTVAPGGRVTVPTGELRVGMVNLSQEAYTIQPGERIAQLAVMPVCLPNVEETDELGDTERGAGGFGSTGRL